MAIDRGGFEEVLEFASRAVGVGAYQRSTAEAMAFGALEAGMVDVAAMTVAPYGPDVGFGDDYMTLFSATAALHVRVELGDLDAAEPIAAFLARFPERWAGAGAAPLGLGFVGLALARDHAARSDVDLAAPAYEQALLSAERAGAVGWTARTLVHQGAFLRSVGGRGADEALARAADLAQRHRLAYVRRRLDRLGPDDKSTYS